MSTPVLDPPAEPAPRKRTKKDAPPEPTGMAVTVLQENLLRGIRLVMPCVAKRSVLPVTTGIKLSTDLGRLRLDATDREVAASVWVGARIDREGAIVAPARMLRDLVAPLGPLTVELSQATGERSHDLKVTTRDVEATAFGFGVEDFPSVETVGEMGKPIRLGAGRLADIYRVCAASAAVDSSRPVLTAILLSGKQGATTLRAVTADGFRLAVLEVPCEPLPADVAIMVPPRVFQVAARINAAGGWEEPVEIAVNERGTGLRVSVFDGVVASTRVQGTYPNYEALIPLPLGGEPQEKQYVAKTRTTVAQDALARAVKLASVISRDGSGIIRLEMSPERGLRLAAKAEGIGEFAMGLLAPTEGEANRIALNAHFLAGAGAIFEGDLTLSLTDDHSQAAFRGSYHGCPVTLVVMPMFVQWDEKR